MLDNIETYLKGIVDWFERLFTIIFEFLGDIGVDVN